MSILRFFTGKFLSVLIVGIALLFVAIASCVGFVDTNSILNADALQIPAMVLDVVEDGGSLKDWYMSTAPYYFPDLLIFFVAYLSLPDLFSQIVFCGVLQVTLTFVAIWLYAANTTRRFHIAYAAFSIILIIWIGLIPAGSYSDIGFLPVFSLIYIMAFHYGCFLMTSLFVGLWLILEDPRRHTMRWTVFLFMTALAFLTGASDKLFIIQAAAPLVGVVWFMDLIRWRFSWKRLFAPLFFLGAAFLGGEAHPYFHPKAAEVGYYLSWDMVKILVPERGAEFIRTMWDNLRPSPLYSGMMLLSLAALMHAFYRLFRRKVRSPREWNLLFLTLFPFFSFLAVLVVQLCISTVPIGDRYFMVIFFFPFIIPVLYAGYYGGRPAAALGVLASIAILCMIGTNIVGYARQRGAHFQYYSEEIACIDNALEKTGGRSGMGNYWLARPLHLFSKFKPNVAVIDFNSMRNAYWVVSDRSFRDVYDFAVVGWEESPDTPGTARNNLILINGPPVIEDFCAGAVLLAYPPGGLSLKRFAKVGSSYFWRGCQHGSFQARGAPGCAMELDNRNERTLVTYLRPKPLQAGRYSVIIGYETTEDAGRIAGDWDVNVATKDYKVLATGEMPGTGGKTGEIKGEFTVLPEDVGQEIEVRVFVQPNTRLRHLYTGVKWLE